MEHFDFLSEHPHYSKIESLGTGSYIIVIRQWGEQQRADVVYRKSEPRLFFVSSREFLPDRVRIGYVEPGQGETTSLYPKTDFERRKYRLIVSERTGTASIIEPDDTRFD